MKTMMQRKTWFALLALILLLAACKGESPTAPPSGGGQTPGGGGTTPPPTGVTLTLTASNENPLVDSTVTITATATQNNQPVPNGTAVEFETTDGGLDNSNATAILKTTTNGVATVALTSSEAGAITVRATVGNVSRTVTVTFRTTPVDPPLPPTVPTITSVSPTVGRPQGGETITITGTNFKGPVKVLFDVGDPLPVEAFVVSATETQIQVLTPGVNLGAGQQLATDIIVLTQAGTAAQQRVEATGAFTFRNLQLTPVISTATPNSGPILGGTRVTIFGEGFQAPVQVLFGAAEARVLTVEYSQIIVESPAARDTSETGSGPVVGQVAIVVRNIESNQSDTMEAGFRYIHEMQITAAGPTEGPFTGGTRVEIEGVGFVCPVAVSIGGVAAQPVFCSGTKVIALTPGVGIANCADQPGPIVVTNIANGDSAEGPVFIYRITEPVIVSASGNPSPGGSVTVVVANAIGFPRLSLNDTNLSITSEVDNGAGLTTYTATIPTTVVLDTEACPAVPGAIRRIPTQFSITYTSVTTGCTDTLTNGVTVSPAANAPILTVIPASFTPFTAVITPADPGPPVVPASVAPSSPQSVTVTNTGTGNLNITAINQVGCGNFTVNHPPTPQTLTSCDPFPITAVYRGTTTPQTEQCSVSIVTNVGTRTLTLSGTSQ